VALYKYFQQVNMIILIFWPEIGENDYSGLKQVDGLHDYS